MQMMKAFLMLGLAIIWLPVSSHCLLIESSAALEFLACCTHTDTNAAPEHHADDCATDPCAVVEGAKYKSSFQRVTVPPLATQVTFELPPLCDSSLISASGGLHQSGAALAQLPVTWQFSARTALPPRAPSLVS